MYMHPFVANYVVFNLQKVLQTQCVKVTDHTVTTQWQIQVMLETSTANVKAAMAHMNTIFQMGVGRNPTQEAENGHVPQ